MSGNWINAWAGPAVVAVIVAVSAVVALRHLAPQFTTRLQAALARRLQRASSTAARRWGQRLMPLTKAGGDCDSGCGTCSGCAPKDPPAEQPIEFTRRH